MKCPTCGAAMPTSQAEWVKRRVALGFCARCNEKREDDRQGWYCRRCGIFRAAYAKKLYKRLGRTRAKH